MNDNLFHQPHDALPGMLEHNTAITTNVYPTFHCYSFLLLLSISRNAKELH